MVAVLAQTVRKSSAEIANVELGTAINYSVLAGSTVTNTGPSVLVSSIGLSPGSAVTGFPPGSVTTPGTIDISNPAAVTAKGNLTTAYLDSAGRSVTAVVTADLSGLELGPGVYSAGAKAPLALTSTLTLNGGGDNNAVFIFQTDSTLITSSSSVVNLINGANACRVFWQVGSSATLGTNSIFAGSILALTSITATTGAAIEGQLLAQNGAVTLDTNTISEPSCVQTPATTTTTTTTTTTVPPTTTIAVPASTTVPASSTTVSRATTTTLRRTTTTVPRRTTTTLRRTTTTAPRKTTTTAPRPETTTIPAPPTTVVDSPDLPASGSNGRLPFFAALLLLVGFVLRGIRVRHRM